MWSQGLSNSLSERPWHSEYNIKTCYCTLALTQSPSYVTELIQLLTAQSC